MVYPRMLDESYIPKPPELKPLPVKEEENEEDFLEEEDENFDPTLFVGRRFRNFRVAERFLKKYAELKLFEITKTSTKRKRTSENMKYSCSRAGKSNWKKVHDESKRRKSQSMKCGCTFFVWLSGSHEGGCKITSFNDQHQLPCNPSEAQLLRCRQKNGRSKASIPDHIIRKISLWINNSVPIKAMRKMLLMEEGFPTTTINPDAVFFSNMKQYIKKHNISPDFKEGDETGNDSVSSPKCDVVNDAGLQMPLSDSFNELKSVALNICALVESKPIISDQLMALLQHIKQTIVTSISVEATVDSLRTIQMDTVSFFPLNTNSGTLNSSFSLPTMSLTQHTSAKRNDNNLFSELALSPLSTMKLVSRTGAVACSFCGIANHTELSCRKMADTGTRMSEADLLSLSSSNLDLIPRNYFFDPSRDQLQYTIPDNWTHVVINDVFQATTPGVENLVVASVEGLDQNGDNVPSWPPIYISLIALQTFFSSLRAAGVSKILLNGMQTNSQTMMLSMEH